MAGQPLQVKEPEIICAGNLPEEDGVKSPYLQQAMTCKDDIITSSGYCDVNIGHTGPHGKATKEMLAIEILESACFSTEVDTAVFEADHAALFAKLAKLAKISDEAKRIVMRLYMEYMDENLVMNPPNVNHDHDNLFEVIKADVAFSAAALLTLPSTERDLFVSFMMVSFFASLGAMLLRHKFPTAARRLGKGGVLAGIFSILCRYWRLLPSRVLWDVIYGISALFAAVAVIVS